MIYSSVTGCIFRALEDPVDPAIVASASLPPPDPPSGAAENPDSSTMLNPDASDAVNPT